MMIKFNELFESDNPSVDSSANNKPYKYSTPWVDKYRPNNLNSIVYQDDVIKMLKNVLETGNLPHLLFYGASGVGKTTTILAIARELFGPRKFDERVIELNASDERGINIVRNKLVSLAKMAVSEKDPKYLCPPYKIIILDEADAMTTEAQSALRKIMEDYSNITRFCFICNYIKQIIDPITSRCVKFRFKPINEENMVNRLNFIADSEKMKLGKNVLQTISNVCNGDLRKAIMLLQNLNYLKREIIVDDVYNISNIVPTSLLNKTIRICTDVKNKTTKNISNLVEEIISEGYPINNILLQLTNAICKSNKIDDHKKSLICFHISITEKRLIDGADEYCQLLSVLMYIKSVMLGYEKELLMYSEN